MMIRLMLFLALNGVVTAAPLTLNVEPGHFSTTTVSTGSGQAVRQTDFSGVLAGEVVLDAVTRLPQAFRFEGGSLQYGNAVSQYTPAVLPGTEELTFTGQGLGGPISSAEGWPGVDAVTGLLNNTEHFQTLSTGTLRTVYRQLFFGFWVTLYDETIDFAAAPQTNPFLGATTLTAELLEEGPLLDRYHIEVEHVSDATPVVYNVPSTDITLTSVTTGGFRAHGEALVPSAGFQAWMMAGGAEEPVSLETQVGAWPGSVLYALGLAPGVREIPWTLDPAAGTLRLDLPAGGTRAALRVEHSPALSGWQALPLPGGGTALPAGTSGPVTVTLPSGAAGYLRLAVSGLPGGGGS